MTTKVISVRIPLELYEEILKETRLRDVNVSEWVSLQFALVKDFDKKIETIKRIINDCPHPHCQTIRRIRYILRDSPLSI